MPPLCHCPYKSSICKGIRGFASDALQSKALYAPMHPLHPLHPLHPIGVHGVHGVHGVQRGASRCPLHAPYGGNGQWARGIKALLYKARAGTCAGTSVYLPVHSFCRAVTNIARFPRFFYSRLTYKAELCK